MLKLPGFLPSVTPGLYVVATPIGSLGDLTLRALDVLTRADVVVCEDTRVTGKLLSAYGLSKKMIVYNDHKADRPQVLSLLESGQIVALVSDAGTPLISDPGYKLVKSCYDAGLPITVVPGASSVMAAMVASGQPSNSFLFAGFVEPKQLPQWRFVPSTLIFFESAGRLLTTLAIMKDLFVERPHVSVCRELTKLYEEVQCGTWSDVIAHYEAHPPKGEIVLVISPPESIAPQMDTVDDALQDALKTHSLKDACTLVAGALGLPRKVVYQRAIARTQHL